MGKRTKLHIDPPAEVTALLAQLGANLRLARARRGLSVKATAEAIGVGARAVREAERGSVSTSIGVSVALLSHFGLAAEVAQLAAPDRDLEGLRQGGGRVLQRARRKGPPPLAAPAAPKAPASRARGTPPAGRDDEALLGLPGAVLRGLEAPELAALRLLQRNSSARTTELARAIHLSPSRVGGLMRALNHKLHGKGFGGVLRDERLAGGEALFRFTRGTES